MRKLLTIFAVATGVSVALRIYLMQTCIEPATGFYKRGAGLPVQLFTAAILLTLALAFVMRLRYAKRYQVSGPVTPPGDKTAAALHYLVGVTVLASGVLSLFFTAPADYSASAFVIAGISVLSGISLVRCGRACAKEEATADIYMSLLTFTVWALVMLITTFLSFSTIATISEHTLEVLMMATAMLFLFFDVKGKASFCNPGKIVGYGLAAIYFISLSCIPRLFFILLPKQIPIYSQPVGFTLPTYLAILVYTVHSLMTLETAIEDGIVKGILQSDEDLLIS